MIPISKLFEFVYDPTLKNKPFKKELLKSSKRAFMRGTPQQHKLGLHLSKMAKTA